MIDWEEILEEDEDYKDMLRDSDIDIECCLDDGKDTELFKKIDLCLPLMEHEVEYLINEVCPYELNLNTIYDKAHDNYECTEGYSCEKCWKVTLKFNGIKILTKGEQTNDIN